MNRAYYSDSISIFLTTSPEEIIGKIALKNEFAMEQAQKDAWLSEINILREVSLQRHITRFFQCR